MADSQKLKTIFPNASSSFLELNSVSSNPKPEPIVRHGKVGKDERKKENTKRCILRYTSYRRELLDPENVCTKFFTDALRYCGAISDDTEAHIAVSTSQKKVDDKSQEKTLIEIIYPPE